MTPTRDTIPVVHLHEVDSTNTHARRWLDSGTDTTGPRWFTASIQTAGRGREGREWSSPAGGLWTTLAWPVAKSPEGILIGLGLRIGVALTETVAAAGPGDRARLKWPNDVLVDGKKIAGVLTEVVSVHAQQWILVGCGVNIENSSTELPEPLRSTAISLRECGETAITPSEFRSALSQRLQAALATEGFSPDTLQTARRLLFGVGELATVRRGTEPTVQATLIGLSDDGRALFRGDNGTEFTAEPVAGS